MGTCKTKDQRDIRHEAVTHTEDRRPLQAPGKITMLFVVGGALINHDSHPTHPHHLNESCETDHMDDRRFFNQQLPQMLQGAILFSYLNGAFSLLNLVTGGGTLNLILVAGAFGAFGIANERKWGYRLCLVCAVLFLGLQLVFFWFAPFAFSIMLSLLFSVFLLALLAHPVSRSYQRIYFR